MKNPYVGYNSSQIPGTIRTDRWDATGRYYRDARMMTVHGGIPEKQKLIIVYKMLAEKYQPITRTKAIR